MLHILLCDKTQNLTTIMKLCLSEVRDSKTSIKFEIIYILLICLCVRMFCIPFSAIWFIMYQETYSDTRLDSLWRRHSKRAPLVARWCSGTFGTVGLLWVLYRIPASRMPEITGLKQISKQLKCSNSICTTPSDFFVHLVNLSMKLIWLRVRLHWVLASMPVSSMSPTISLRLNCFKMGCNSYGSDMMQVLTMTLEINHWC